MSTLSELLAKTGLAKQASAAPEPKAPEAAPAAVDPVKVAADTGAQEAEDLLKIAAVVGDVIGKQAAASFKQELGATEDLAKTASLQDVIEDAFVKALEGVTKTADAVTGTRAQADIAASQAEQLQVGELTAHHANLAAQAAADAVQSMSQGDEHTATQMLETAGASIATAHMLAERCGDPAVHQHVAEAAAAVQRAADVATAHTSAAQ